MSSITPSNQASELILIQDLPLDQNPAAVYLASLSNGGRRTMRQALGNIADLLFPGKFVKPEKPGDGASKAELSAYEEDLHIYHHRCLLVPWAALRFQHTTAIRTKLSGSYAPATANKMLSAMRGTLKAAWKLDQMSAEDYHKAASVESVNGETIISGRDLSDGEIRALVESCEKDPSPAGARDAAILAVLCPPCGIRRAEVIALDLEDYSQDNGRLVVRGKRNKQRTVYLVNGARRAMIDWLSLRGIDPGPLFFPINKAGEIIKERENKDTGQNEPARLTTQAIYNMLLKRGKEAKVEDFSPHDFRRTTAGDLLDAGVDIITVQKILGHADPKTTGRYDRRPEQAKLDAAGKVHFPYRGRG